MDDLGPYEIAQALRLQLVRINELIQGNINTLEDYVGLIRLLSKSRETLTNLITALEE
jgi:plasmid maintenance system antidote protein VapI